MSPSRPASALSLPTVFRPSSASRVESYSSPRPPSCLSGSGSPSGSFLPVSRLCWLFLAPSPADSHGELSGYWVTDPKHWQITHLVSERKFERFPAKSSPETENNVIIPEKDRNIVTDWDVYIEQVEKPRPGYHCICLLLAPACNRRWRRAC